MSEKITSILFIGIVGLVLVGMVVGITIAIIKRLGRGQAYRSVASQYGWTYMGNDTKAVEEVESKLQPTMFSVQQGDHDVSQVVTGEVGGRGITIVRHRYSTTKHMAEHGRGGTYTLVVYERGGQRGGEHDGRFFFVHRTKGALGNIAESVAGGAAPSDANWEWAYFTPSTTFETNRFDPDGGRRLGELTQPGDAIFVFENLVVYGMKGELNEKRIAGVREIMPVLYKLFQ